MQGEDTVHRAGHGAMRWGCHVARDLPAHARDIDTCHVRRHHLEHPEHLCHHHGELTPVTCAVIISNLLISFVIITVCGPYRLCMQDSDTQASIPGETRRRDDTRAARPLYQPLARSEHPLPSATDPSPLSPEHRADEEQESNRAGARQGIRQKGW